MSNSLTPEEQYRLAALRMLAAAFPHNKVGADTIRVYMGALADLDMEHLKGAIVGALTGRFFPSIRELRIAAMDNDPDMRIASAVEAWEEVRGTILGVYHSEDGEDFSTHLIEEAVRRVGLGKVYREGHRDIIRLQFQKVYEGLVEAEREHRITLVNNADAWDSLTNVARKMKALTDSQK
ncbi:MAG: hypothetical protein GY847_38620 [Proteobacteria bacterium]|nr:hypothetical protein [Pseudomonadota bacterium]